MPRRVLLALIMLLGVCAVLPAAASTAERVAAVSASAGGLVFSPLSEFAGASMTLAVSGPQGLAISKTFPPGGLPLFDAQSVGCAVLPDGQYRYDLRASFPARHQAIPGIDDAGRSEIIPVPAVAAGQSGFFRVQGGSVSHAATSESASDARMDILQNDDVIVTGNQCIGSGCADGMSFDSTPLVLKALTPGILFDDTSLPGDPDRDWRLTANDALSGGAQYFAIEDVTAGRTPVLIEGGAPADALRIDDSGRIGLGTATPTNKLHMVYGDTPAVRLEQNGGGWPAQTWDIAGNEANFFVRDLTNSSKLPLRIKPGAPTNSLYIKADGFVGLGTEAPTRRLHVEGDAYIKGTLEIGSSRSLKTDIHPLPADAALAALRALVPVTFVYTANPAETCVGFIAEDVPELLATTGHASLSPMDFVAVLTSVVQSQQETIAALAARVEALERAAAQPRQVVASAGGAVR